MRTITAAQQAVRDSGSQADFCRVSVKDSGGTFRDLTTYPGFNAVKSVRYQEDVDSPHMTADVVLRREQFKLSLSPFVAASALNKGFNPSGAFAALLAVGREVKIEVAIVAMDHQPQSGDWLEVFRGRIDTLDAGNGANIKLSCRDLGGRLAQQYIKYESVLAFASVAGLAVPMRIWEPQMVVVVGDYMLPATRGTGDSGNNRFFVCSIAGTTGSVEPTWGTGSAIPDDSDGGPVEWDYVGAPSTGGFAVEQVIQNILDRFKASGDPTVTLYTPASPSWAIRQFLQGRETVLTAIRKLANQIGWDLRFKWRSGTNQFELTLYEPSRASPSVDFTFPASEYLEPERFAVDISELRNAWQIIFADRADTFPDGSPKRKVIQVFDSASITKYGELWAEIQEDFNSQVDTSTEATKLANAALADCKEPTADFGVPLARGFPWVETNDYYTFGFDNLRFDSSQSLAVTGWSQTFESGDKPRLVTRLSVRGKPTIGAGTFLSRSSHPAAIAPYEPHRVQHFNGTDTPVATLSPEVGGFAVATSESVDKGQLLNNDLELHVSTISGFTPGFATLKTVVKGGGKTVSDLVPGKPYYVKTVKRWFNAGRLVRGQPSAEQSFVAGRAKSGHYDSAATQSHLPLNGNFEHALDDLTTAPPDHWQVVTRPAEATETWGSSGSVYYGTDASKGRYIELRAVASQRGNIVSSQFEVRRGLRNLNIYLSIMRTGSSAVSGKDLIVDVSLYADAALGTLVRSDSIFLSGSAAGPYPSLSTWYDTVIDYGGGFGALPTNANFMVIALRRSTTGDNTFAWRIGDVYAQEADFYRASIDQPAWAAPSFATNWANVGGAYQTAGYFKDSFGLIHLRGQVKVNTGTLTTTIFTLPSGFRPSATEQFPLRMGTAVLSYLEVDTSGNVKYAGSGGGVLADAQSGLSLAGITFDTR